MTRLAAWAVTFALTVLTTGVAADSVGSPSADADQRARRVFEKGRQAFADGDFESALGKFRHAYELSGKAELLFNIGSAAEKLQRDEAALDAFERYLDARPDAPNRALVESRIQHLRKSLRREAELERQLASKTKDAERSASDARRTQKPRERGASIVTKWWLWTAVGAVVAGVAIGAAVAATRDDGRQEPVEGDIGGVVFTLRER